jgi:hypothetical protein
MCGACNTTGYYYKPLIYMTMRKSYFIALLLIAAGLQTTFAQKVQRQVMMVKYGNDQTFKHTIEDVKEVTFGTVVEDWEYVDLGLPSGTLWATCNVGAEKPEDSGYFLAWGETTPKGTYNWNTYKLCKDGSSHNLTKYCSNYYYGYNNYEDNFTELLAADDAATANPDWGNEWQIASVEQFDELFSANLTTRQWTIQNGQKGMLLTSKKNGKSIFLPAVGAMNETTHTDDDENAIYWTRSLYLNYPYSSFVLIFTSNNSFTTSLPVDRYAGLPVRAVRRYKN